MPDESIERVQTQFGRSASDYASSAFFSGGEDLHYLLELTRPEARWSALDVATGAGHTAFAFASRVNGVIATDVTREMLAEAEALASRKGLTNVETRVADACDLPFPDATFDLVSCRLGAHHFHDIDAAFRGFARVLRPGGVLAFADNITVEETNAARYYNEIERLRDPSHGRVLPPSELTERIEAVGFVVEATRKLTKEFEFHTWADRQRVSIEDKERLLQMMRTMPPELEALFAPRWAEGTLYFSLWEIVLAARVPADR